MRSLRFTASAHFYLEENVEVCQKEKKETFEGELYQMNVHFLNQSNLAQVFQWLKIAFNCIWCWQPT